MPGKSNVFADGLSRRPDLRLMLVGALGGVDSFLKEICDGVQQKRVAKKYWNAARSANKRSKTPYSLLHGVLYYTSDGRHRIYVPEYKNLRRRLLEQYHATPAAGHFGVEKCYRAISQFYYWPAMRDDMAAYIKGCPICQRMKVKPQSAPELRPLPAPSRLFEFISMDWVGGFPKNKHGHNSILNIVCKFCKWIIAIPCDKHMTSDVLCKLLYDKVFSWTGLPLKILGDNDTRLTASQTRALCKYLGVRLMFSTAYHPQTDGQSENAHKILMSVMRAFVNKYHSDWEDCIPSVLYAYHNTIHSATGYTPHHLLFGWTPQDLRVPFVAAELNKTDISKNVDAWLELRKEHLKHANINLEYARTAMMKARKSAASTPAFKVGDKVKVSVAALPLRCPSTQSEKLQQKYLGPYSVIEVVNPGAYRLKLSDDLAAVYDTFNEAQLRPWFDPGADRELDLTNPAVQPHPALNRVVQVLDRKTYGRVPKTGHVLDIPAQYLCARRVGPLEWIQGRHLREPEEQALVKKFEWRFPRSAKLPCESVNLYKPERYEDEAAWVSDDELDLGLADDLGDRFGPGAVV